MPQLSHVSEITPKEVVLTSDSSAFSSDLSEHYPRHQPRAVDWSEFIPELEPGIVLLRHLSVTGRKLRFPLYLAFEHTEEGDTVVTDPVMHLYGIGPTLGEALADDEAMLLEHHEHLTENAFRLAAKLQEQLRYLNILLA